MKGRKRVIIARLGMDAHWRGSIMVARALRDAGCEVVYIGNQTPEAIVSAVEDEDAEVLGLSSLSGNHMVLTPEVMSLLRSKGLDRVTVILGGTVAPHEAPELRSLGVSQVFGPGSSLTKIVECVLGNGREPNSPDALSSG